ncbi:MAG TPA: FAD-dependent oxidoreductase [Candidatus Binataceae bacterium]|nr:FAD-dependent oxidoreductase [Candidatus Binataceae bacterium]
MAGRSASEASARNLRRAIVDRIFNHNSDTRSLFLRITSGGPLKFTPGQFVSLSIPLQSETLTRAYSIASDPESDSMFEMCFNRVANGRGTPWLFDRAAGDSIDFTGPYGLFVMEGAPSVETVMIAEETAIAPIRPMIRRASRSQGHAPIFLLYGASTPDRILYRSELEETATRDCGFRFETTIEGRESLYDRLAEIVRHRWIDADANRTRQFYICGIGKSVSRLRDMLRSAGYERRSVRYEQW